MNIRPPLSSACPPAPAASPAHPITAAEPAGRIWPDGTPVTEATEAALARMADLVHTIQAKHRAAPAP